MPRVPLHIALYLAFSYCAKGTNGLNQKMPSKRKQLGPARPWLVRELIPNVSDYNPWNPDTITAFIIVPIKSQNEAVQFCVYPQPAFLLVIV